MQCSGQITLHFYPADNYGRINDVVKHIRVELRLPAPPATAGRGILFWATDPAFRTYGGENNPRRRF